MRRRRRPPELPLNDPKPGDPVDAQTALRLARAFETLNRHRFVRIHNSTRRLMWFQFLRGLAFGLGSVLGASILVSFLVLALSQISFVPIIGEWAQEVIEEIERSVEP